MIELLANLQPFLLIGMLAGMYGIENIWPSLERPMKRWRHDGRNTILCGINFVVNAALGLVVVEVLEWTAGHKWGLLNQGEWPYAVKTIAGVLLIDLGSFSMHNLQHRLPFLWRFHRVHHSDANLNATTSLRFHPVDTVVAQCIAASATVAVCGIPMDSFVIYGTIALPLLVMQHSNVKFPGWLEKYGRLVFATPGWHKIHHSANQPETDSHYGDVFTFWDRLFGTWGEVKPHEVSYGLDEFSRDEQHGVGYLMLSPFRRLNKKRVMVDGKRENVGKPADK